MDDNAQGAVSQTVPGATQKQQVTELLRSGTNIVITVGDNPSIDAYSATVALAQILSKLGKRAEAVVSSSAPKELSFLPTELLSNKFAGLRDFVIELDISKTEADKLKYVPEGKRLKIYITPYNGNFTKDDLGFSYGDYRCDGVIVLGANNPSQIDHAISSQKQLIGSTKVYYLTAGANGGNGETVWNEPTASSISEMLMSLTEALQPGLLDNHIATSLLTGIMASTNHFTGTNTTPKVMTMAAQLMAAGANQAEIVANLQTLGSGRAKNTNQISSGPHQLQPSGEETLPHKSVRPNKNSKIPQGPSLPPSHKSEPLVSASPLLTTPDPIFPPPQQPPVMPPSYSLPPLPPQMVSTPSPAHSPMISGVRTEHDGNAFATLGGTPLNTPPNTAGPVVNSTPGNSSLVAGEHKTIDLDAARQAVEAAASQVPMPTPQAVTPPPVPAMPPMPGNLPIQAVNQTGPQPPVPPVQ